MTINVKLSLCKITRASRLFQRNYYLPLFRPLSPRDALRRKLLTGQNVLGSRIEHYIPVLTKNEDKKRDKRSRPKGAPIIKKRIKRKDGEKYVTPFFDDNLENHLMLQSLLLDKGREKNQFYIYEIPDKKCTLVLSNVLEKAIKDRDVVDVTIAQRSEKIVLRMKDDKRVVLPLAKFTQDGVMYRGSGWTKADVEEDHHHGKDTMSLARMFDAKDAGLEDWEVEMIRMTNRRKKKVKGEESADWKMVVQAASESLDWEEFEEISKQIVEELEEPVEKENIPMEVEDMEKTRDVERKLLEGGEEILVQLPTIADIPEVVRNLEAGNLCELQDVAGVKVPIGDGRECFVAGQMVKTEENEVFMPGQTIEDESGTTSYIPGVTVLLDDEPSLIPGLVFGEEEQPAVFLPGISSITEDGQLAFEANEDDVPASPPRQATPPPVNAPKVIDTYLRRGSSPPVLSFRPERQPLEDCLVLYEERRRRAEELDKKRAKERTEQKIMKAESRVDSVRYQIRMKLRNFKVEQPQQYKPLEPVQKSKKLEELETNFEDEHTKTIMEKVRSNARKYRHVMMMSSYGYDKFGTPSSTH